MAETREPADLQRDLEMLAAELRRLEAEYNMFFAGRLPRPPWETRARVERIVKRWDRAHIVRLVDRFRLSTLQARYVTFADLWDRALRAREEGRPGPFSWGIPNAERSQPSTPPEQIVRVVAFADPWREIEKLRDLYGALMGARREAGEPVVAFHTFADRVREQVARVQAQGCREVAFRVGVREGRVTLTVRGLKGIEKGRRDEPG